MSLARKMLSRSSKACSIRSTCRKESDRKYFGSLFQADWEVFVIQHDKGSGKFSWFTLCCEAANTTRNVKIDIFPAACC
jgi:hypothetical protein